MAHTLYNVNSTELNLWSQFGMCKKFAPLIGSGDKTYSQYKVYKNFTQRYVFPQKDILKVEKQLQLQATIFRVLFENQYVQYIKEQFLKYDVNILSFDFSDIKNLLYPTLNNTNRYILCDSNGTRLLAALVTQVIYEYCTDRREAIEDIVKQVIDVINNKSIGGIYTKKKHTANTVEVISPDDELIFLPDRLVYFFNRFEELYDKLFYKDALSVNKQVFYDDLALNKNDLVNIFNRMIRLY